MALLPFLSSHGILGLNARNLLYIKPFNQRKATAFADDKLRTKLFLSTRDIPVPKVYATIENRRQLCSFNFTSLPDACVLKPNFGYGGEGIRILTGRKKGVFLEKGKDSVTEQNLIEHIEDILDGKFSVNGRSDTAFFEELLVPHKCFAQFRPAGLPDIRIVCFNLVPVMAMLRIPTAESGGKANMHLGGIGIGIDLSKGTTTYAAQKNVSIETLPHGGDFRNIEIPYWDEILSITSRIQQVTNIGYLAADIIIAQDGGPKLLEVNARAGLSVQIANLAPLRARLQRVSGLHVPTPEKGVLLGKELFGSTLTRPTSAATATIGLYETILIPAEDGNIELDCVVSTKHDRTAFSPDLVQELKGRGVLEVENEEEQTYRVRFALNGKKIKTVVVAKELKEADVRVSIGRRDIVGFLIDPTRTVQNKHKTKRAKLKIDLFAVDRQLKQLMRDVPFLKALKPMNMENHLSRLEEEKDYQPVFEYESVSFDAEGIVRRFQELRVDTSPFGRLLKKKKDELVKRINLLAVRGDTEAFTKISKDLFGNPTEGVLASAQQLLSSRKACTLPGHFDDLLSVEKVKERFEDVLKSYALHDWEVQIRKNLLADCAVGGKKVFLREDVLFEPAHVEALIAHEIEAHVLTSENAAHQPYHLLQMGCANYLDTQEGLAIYLQNRVLPDDHDKRYWAARSALGVAYALDHDFVRTRTYLESLGYTEKKALRKTLSLKRGLGDTSVPGAFVKDIVYYRGFLKIQEFVRQGGDLKRLYVGRVALEDLEAIEKLPDLRSPTVYPHFLREEKH